MAVTYDKSEIKQKIFVPAAVESELRTNIENQLNKCGIFYRVFSRRKSAASLEHKFASKKYGGNDGKKIQDLIGIRVNVYFQDDLDICKKLFEDIFELVEDGWSETDVSRQNFEAAKINGVFRLPEHMADKISKETWEMAIDKTFEIQLKTVFFEGWHEVEHDFRYKIDGKDPEDESNVWNRYAKYSRQLNSVVATLELCDRSMLNMFESFAHDLYKNREWEMMIRMHYRVRISSAPIYDGIKELLEANECELGKKLLKARRYKLLEALNRLYRNVPISVNMIIAILNDIVLDSNPEIAEIMKKNNVYNDGRLEAETSYERRDLLPLNEYVVFHQKVLIKSAHVGDAVKSEEAVKAVDLVKPTEVFQTVVEHLYSWIKYKYREIFPDMPDVFSAYENMTCGYLVRFKLNQEEMKLAMETSHIAFDVGGRMWNTEVELWPDEQQQGIWMELKNCMRDRENVSDLERVSRFSYPRFYRDIYRDSDLRIYDVKCYKNKPYVIRDGYNVDRIQELVASADRISPVVILASDMVNTDTGYIDESWIGDRWLDSLYNQVKYYAHVYRCDVEQLQEVLSKTELTVQNQRGVYVFWPNDSQKSTGYEFYGEQDIEECEHSRFKGEGAGVREDKLRNGAQAFMFKLVDEIKSNNIK